MTTNEQKIEKIRETMAAMAVGSCGIKWDRVVWRISENGWIVGDIGVRKDAFVHSLESVVEWFAWKRGIPASTSNLTAA